MGILFNIAMTCRILHKKDHTIWRCHMVWYLGICTALYMSAGIYFLCLGDIYSFLRIYYLSWLMVMAYVDYRTGYVYNCMEYTVIFPLLLCLVCIYNTKDCSMYAAVFGVAEVIYAVVIQIFTHMGCMGEGDRDILIVNSVIMSTGIINNMDEIHTQVYMVMECIADNMVFSMLASGLFVIRNIRYIKLKKLRLKKSRPFLPSIYMAAVIMFFIK